MKQTQHVIDTIPVSYRKEEQQKPQVGFERDVGQRAPEHVSTAARYGARTIGLPKDGQHFAMEWPHE